MNVKRPELSWSRLRSAADDLFAAAVLVVVATLSFSRLKYGVDFRDEAFYAVLSQRFALGDKAYVDELNLRQTASLLVSPFYWVYLHVVGSTDGVMLFLRRLFHVLQWGTAIALYTVARLKVRRSYALLAAAVPLSFVPFTVPTLSYNNTGSYLFALGLCLALVRLLRAGSPLLLVAAGVVHALACVAYPPLALPVAAFAGLALLWAPLHLGRRCFSVAYGGGLVGCALAFAAVLGPRILHGLHRAMQYEGQLTRPRNLVKLGQLLDAVSALSPPIAGSVGTLAAAWLLARAERRTRSFLPLALMLPLLWWFGQPRAIFGDLVPAYCLSLHISIYGAILGVVFVLLAPADTRRVLAWVWIPSLLAGVTMVMSSDNIGCMNGGLGTFAAAAFLPIAAALAADPEQSLSPSARWPVLIAIALVSLTLVRVNYQACYWDGPVDAQTTRVHVGPYRGMFGTRKKAGMAEELTDEIRMVAKPGERMLSYYDLPAAYLTVETRPALPTSWTDARAKLELMLPEYRAHRTGDGLVVVLNGQHASTALEQLTQERERLLKDLGWVRIYREPPP